MDAQNYIGEAGNPATQGLGRLVSQYCNSANLKTLLTGVLAMANDLDLLLSRVQRVMNPSDDVTYDPGALGVYPVNTQGAQGFQLQIIGAVVGVTNVVPQAGEALTPLTLTDEHFRLLINAKIFRNHVHGCTIPQLLQAIQIIMPDLTSAEAISIEETGAMVTYIEVNRQVQDWEAGIFAIPAGHIPIKGAVLPRPTGVALATAWWDTGCFTWSTEADQTVLVDPTGEGFNTDESITTGTGRWAESF